jgi:transposase
VSQAEIDEKGNGQGALTTDERAELTRLRRELRTVEQERDFLKKTAAYFAKSQS